MAFEMLFGSFMLKTSKEMSLSLHIDAAVESITFKFFAKTSLNVMSEYFLASGFLEGSISYNTSTFVDLNMI